MAYIVAFILIVVFTINVVLGAVSNAPLFSNVIEMLVLFAAAIAFCVGILKSEAREKAKQDQ